MAWSRSAVLVAALIVNLAACRADDPGRTVGDTAGPPAGDPVSGDAASSDPGVAGDPVGDPIGDPGAGDPGTGCGLAGLEGSCESLHTCTGAAFIEECGGPPAIECCLDGQVACSVSGAPGICIDTAACTGSWFSTAGLCPGAANIQCCTETGAACVDTAKPLPNEGLSEESFDVGCPDGMLTAGSVCVDVFEASLVELDSGGAVVASWSPYVNPGSTRVKAVSVAGGVPQGYIDADQAEAACDEAGKRLCTDAEWLRACQGSSSTTYPYGNTREPGVCNDARSKHPAVEYFGTSDAWIWSELGNSCINQIPESVAPTGEHPGCVSEDGLFDMMGNLHEWTSDPAGTFRGGFYADTTLNGNGCLYATTAHNRLHWDYSTGFRCCAEPL